MAAVALNFDFDTPFPGARQVAVVIAALGNEARFPGARPLLAPEVEAIIREVKDMDGVPAAEVNDLMGELRDEAVAQTLRRRRRARPGPRPAARAATAPTPTTILEQIMAASARCRSSSCASAPPEQIVSYLSAEHPQVIALVLAHLPLTLAASVIEGLPIELRATWPSGTPSSKRSIPTIVDEVEAALQRRVGSKATWPRRNATKGGVKPLAQLLNSVARDTEKAVLSDLERADPDLAAAVRDLMFVFEDLGSHRRPWAAGDAPLGRHQDDRPVP